MPLLPTALADALTAIFDGDAFPESAGEAGERWAQAYRDYAGDALAGPTAPVSASLEAARTTLAGALAGAFTAAQSAGPAALVPTASAAFAAFWLLPPVAFLPPLPAPPAIAGVVTVAVPGALPAALSAALAAGVAGATAAAQGQAFATALDTFTRTVMVVNTPVTPPGPPSPPAPLM